MLSIFIFNFGIK